MDILVFTENKNIGKIFSPLTRSKTYNILMLPLTELRKTVRTGKNHRLLYVDITGFAEKARNGILNLLCRSGHVLFGIIDPKEEIKDKALLFHKGAADYLGREQCREGITAARLKSVLLFKGTDGPAAQAGTAAVRLSADAASKTPSKALLARNWNMVVPGNEYLFYMMFIELDGHHEISQRVGEKAVGELLTAFQSLVELYIAPAKGRLWIWNDFGGIVLFPYTKNPAAIIGSCMRFMLSRRSASIEQCAQKVLLSYRIVLHTGSSVYRERGKTGRIISDAVNSLSHMGLKFARPGNLYITDDIFFHTPRTLQDCFKKAGQFQCYELYRMKLPKKY